jgi:hypothetical protein
MPTTTLHARLVDLFRARPSALLAALARASPVPIPWPDYDEVTLSTESTSPTREAPLRADVVFVLRRAGAKVAVVIVEVQLRPDPRKRASWNVYAASAHLEHGCLTVLLVVTTSRAVERWAATLPSFTYPGTGVVPIVIGPGVLPRIADASAARAQPWLAILGTLAHARAPDATDLVAPAREALEALGALPGEDGEFGAFLCDMLGRAFEGAARKEWEDAMFKDYEIESPTLKKILRASEAKGEARGRAEGEAEAVLVFLAARGIDVPNHIAERVRACRDLEILGRLIRRAAVIASADQLFADA